MVRLIYHGHDYNETARGKGSDERRQDREARQAASSSRKRERQMERANPLQVLFLSDIDYFRTVRNYLLMQPSYHEEAYNLQQQPIDTIEQLVEKSFEGIEVIVLQATEANLPKAKDAVDWILTAPSVALYLAYQNPKVLAAFDLKTLTDASDKGLCDEHSRIYNYLSGRRASKNISLLRQPSQ